MSDHSRNKRDNLVEAGPRGPSTASGSRALLGPRYRLPPPLPPPLAATTHAAHPALADFYNPIRSHLKCENSALFDKVKRQLSIYLSQTSGKTFRSTGGLKPRSTGNIGRYAARGGGGRLAKRSKQDLVRGIIASSLNDKERVLLKYLLASEQSPSCCNELLLTKTLKRHLYKCLLKITMSIGVKTGLLDLVKRCHVVGESLSVEHNESREIGTCEIFRVSPIRAIGVKVVCVTLALDGQQQEACQSSTFGSAERVLLDRAETDPDCSSVTTAVYSGRPETDCCTVAMVLEEYGVVEFSEQCLLAWEARAAPSVSSCMGPERASTLSTASGQQVLRVDLVFHCLEASDVREPPFCQREISFTYQPNPFNHLIHLCLGLRHHNN